MADNITRAKIESDVQAEAAADYMKMQTNDFTETYMEAAKKKAAEEAAAAAALAAAEKEREERERQEDAEALAALAAAKEAVTAGEAAIEALNQQEVSEDDSVSKQEEVEPLVKKKPIPPDAPLCDETESEAFAVQGWEDKFIWDISELNFINKDGSAYIRKFGKKLEYQRRFGYRQRYGIRAHRDISFLKCFYYMFHPLHNEFLPICIYLGFAIYFWITCILILAEVGVYGTFKEENSTYLAFFVTLFIAMSLTASVIYFLYYSVSLAVWKVLELVNLLFIFAMIFMSILVFAIVELSDTKIWLPVLVSLLLVFVADITLISLGFWLQNPLLIQIAWGITGAVIGVIFFMDYTFIATFRCKVVWYRTLVLETFFLVTGVVLFALKIPEICTRIKYIHLFCSSYIILIICVISFIFEVHNAMIYLIKLNEGSLSKAEQDKWVDQYE